MPVCPRCRTEYGVGTSRCTGCRRSLLRVIPGSAGGPRVSGDADPTDESPEGKLTLLLEEPLPEIAAMISEFLQNCGIDCIVNTESVGLLYRLPAPGAPMSRARVYVRDSDFQEARELVAHFFKQT